MVHSRWYPSCRGFRATATHRTFATNGLSRTAHHYTTSMDEQYPTASPPSLLPIDFTDARRKQRCTELTRQIVEAVTMTGDGGRIRRRRRRRHFEVLARMDLSCVLLLEEDEDGHCLVSRPWPASALASSLRRRTQREQRELSEPKRPRGSRRLRSAPRRHSRPRPACLPDGRGSRQARQ